MKLLFSQNSNKQIQLSVYIFIPNLYILNNFSIFQFKIISILLNLVIIHTKRLIFKPKPVTTMTSQHNKFIHDFLAGGTAGVISKTVCAPIQRIKLLIQTQGENQRLKGHRYNGIIDCFRNCVKHDGFLSLWRGNGINVIRYFPTQALNFSFKDLYSRILRDKMDTQTKSQILFFNILCGGLAGSSTTFFVHPLDFARTRIGVDTGRRVEDRQFHGLRDCLKKTYKKQGLRGLYRGLVIGVCSIFWYRGLYFGIYDTGKQVLFEDQGKDSLGLKMLWAQFSVILAQLISYPGDTIKRKLFMQSLKENKSYSTVRKCVATIYEKQGIRGFFTGSYSNILRGVGSSLCLLIYDQIKDIQHKSLNKKHGH